MMIKAILIDIDDTLLDFEKNAYCALERAFSYQNVPFKPEYFDVFIKINTSLWEMIERKEITKEQLKEIRFLKVFESLNVTVADYRKVEEDFRSELFNFAIPVDGAVNLLKYLASKYKIYAASNAMHNQQLARLKKAGMDGFVSDVFISENIGHYKPTKGFFDVCFEYMGGVDRSETAIIGDSLSADIKGGKEYGLTTIWFNSKNKIKDADSGVDYEVNSLEEIKNIL